jgi:hypothetical protein
VSRSGAGAGTQEIFLCPGPGAAGTQEHIPVPRPVSLRGPRLPPPLPTRLPPPTSTSTSHPDLPTHTSPPPPPPPPAPGGPRLPPPSPPPPTHLHPPRLIPRALKHRCVDRTSLPQLGRCMAQGRRNYEDPHTGLTHKWNSISERISGCIRNGISFLNEFPSSVRLNSGTRSEMKSHSECIRKFAQKWNSIYE